MKYLYFLILLLMLSSCTKDELGPQIIDHGGLSAGSKLAILNEGNFGWSNSSLTMYYDQLHQVSNNVFVGSNAFSLGDVANSMTLINGELYLVVNNSGKIYAIDTNSFIVNSTITGLNSPRHLLDLKNGKAMISELYNDQIEVVDLGSKMIVDTIQVGEWSEKMICHSGFAFVALPESGRIIKIDPINHTIIDTVQLTKGVNSMVLDQNNQIWALCDGGFNEFQPYVYKIDPNDLSISLSITIGNISSSPSNLVVNSIGDELYYLNDELFKLSILASTEPSNSIYSKTNSTFYTLYFDRETESLFLSDVKDYIQNSEMINLDVNGNEQYTFESGIISGAILRIK